MGKVFRWVATTVVALALGAGSAAALINFGGAFDARIVNGAWETGRHTGSASADPYSRARGAIYGLWGLPPSEVVYYTALQDDTGQPLQRSCSYQVSGGALPARWWSVTLYRDYFLIENPARRYSWSSTTIDVAPAGNWRIDVNAAGEGDNALPMGERDGVFALSLRLYQPLPQVLDNRATIELPAIHRGACQGSSS